ncbi:MAG: arylsulfatase [Planctomycetes bacterium]|nr:arylsulfatase [Planctomycetota bacterium]
MRSFLLLAVSIALALSAERPPNIVLIYADDLGYGDLSCYGATAVKTPHCDRVAAEGLRLTSGYCTSATCTPSRYSMLTGEYAWRRKGTGILPGDATMIIEPGRATLPAQLKRAGYATAVVGKWHLGLGTKEHPVDWNGDVGPGPLDIGFDSCFLMPATGDRVPCVYLRDRRVVGLDPADPIAVSYKEAFPGVPTGVTARATLKMDWDYGHNEAVVNGVGRIGHMKGGTAALWKDEDMADVLAREGAAYIARFKDQPFFLYYAAHSIHVPRVVHERFVGATTMGPRGDAIVEFDFQVGVLMDALKANGVAENTLVIITSDNGPVLNDGYKDQAAEKIGDHRAGGPLRGGKYSSFEAGCRVPFLVWGPGVKPGVSDALVSQIDLATTCAGLAGVVPTANECPDSLPQADALLGKDSVGRPWMIEHATGLALRVGQWKYHLPQKTRDDIITRSTASIADPGQLYDLAADPGERTPVEQAERRDAMKAQLTTLRTAAGTRPGFTDAGK